MHTCKLYCYNQQEKFCYTTRVNSASLIDMLLYFDIRKYSTAQFKLDKERVWHVLDTTHFSFRTHAGMRALARLMM